MKGEESDVHWLEAYGHCEICHSYIRGIICHTAFGDEAHWGCLLLVEGEDAANRYVLSSAKSESDKNTSRHAQMRRRSRPQVLAPLEERRKAGTDVSGECDVQEFRVYEDGNA